MNTAAASVRDDEVPSLKGFFLQAVLWLPLAFFLWFVLRSLVVFPTIRIVRAVLLAWLPDLVIDAGQEYTDLVFSVQVASHHLAGVSANAFAVGLSTNVLMYCYNVPLLLGLVMATPLDWTRTFLQWGVGLLLLLPIQAFGVIGDVLKTIYFEIGSAVMSGLHEQPGVDESGLPGLAGRALADTQAALAAHGLNAEALALWYQFGYLILPSLSPVVIWIVFNRDFIEKLTRRRELTATATGPTGPKDTPP